jgi:hypothetical protein
MQVGCNSTHYDNKEGFGFKCKLKAFKGASWFKDEFGLLNKANRKSDHVAPKVLYNLEWGGPTRPSTIYKPAADTAVKGNTKKVGFANVDDVDSKEDSSRGSTSHLSLTSSGFDLHY